MGWHKLTNSELQAMRKLLMLDVSDAARLIGKCSTRSWQYWESGERTVPDDVDTEIYGLVQLRGNMIDELTEKQYKLQKKDEKAVFKMKYYHTFETYSADNKGNEVDWRLHQAAVSEIFSEGGEVELI